MGSIRVAAAAVVVVVVVVVVDEMVPHVGEDYVKRRTGPVIV